MSLTVLLPPAGSTLSMPAAASSTPGITPKPAIDVIAMMRSIFSRPHGRQRKSPYTIISRKVF